MKLFKTTEWLLNKYRALDKDYKAMKDNRNLWLMRAVAMAGPDDLAQWAREGGGPHDINLKDRS